MEREEKISYDHDLSFTDLLWILDNTYGNIFTTDSDGKVLFVNHNTVEAFGLQRDKIIGMNTNELIEDGIITNSTTLKAIETKGVFSNSLKTRDGSELIGISIPKFDEYGEIKMVMTYSQNRDDLLNFSNILKTEKKKNRKLKDISVHYSQIGKQKYLISNSDSMTSIIEFIYKVNKNNIDNLILITGESGTGKDVIANYIHSSSNRSMEPFIPVNCAAIPSELMETEFFGYEKGAFTGAGEDGKNGYLDMAQKGTLFLDEIGELPLNMQAKLLRVIESGEFMKVGSESYKKADVRIVCATNKDLKELVEKKKFREDLYYRLSILPIEIPPLRERQEDIIPLIEMFLNIYNKKYNTNKRLTDKTKKIFKNNYWKGNIRELKNVIHRLVIVSDSDIISDHNINQVLGISEDDNIFSNNTNESVVNHINILSEYEKYEKNSLLEQLVSNKGNKSKTAEKLGISRSKLYRLLEKYSV